MRPAKILSYVPIINSDPRSVHIEIRCSVCGEVDSLVLSLHDSGWGSAMGISPSPVRAVLRSSLEDRLLRLLSSRSRIKINECR